MVVGLFTILQDVLEVCRGDVWWKEKSPGESVHTSYSVISYTLQGEYMGLRGSVDIRIIRSLIDDGFVFSCFLLDLSLSHSQL